MYLRNSPGVRGEVRLLAYIYTPAIALSRLIGTLLKNPRIAAYFFEMQQGTRAAA